jgi:hypothetical protein
MSYEREPSLDLVGAPLLAIGVLVCVAGFIGLSVSPALFTGFVEAAYETTFEGYGSAPRHPRSTTRLHVLPTFCPLA